MRLLTQPTFDTPLDAPPSPPARARTHTPAIPGAVAALPAHGSGAPSCLHNYLATLTSGLSPHVWLWLSVSWLTRFPAWLEGGTA